MSAARKMSWFLFSVGLISAWDHVQNLKMIDGDA